MIYGTLIYDGDCGFCRTSRDLLVRIDHADRVAVLELRDERAPRLAAVSRERLAQRVHWVGADGTVCTGAAAANEALGAALGTRLPMVVYRAPGVAGVQERLYDWVSEHRSAFGSLGAKLTRRSSVFDAKQLASRIPAAALTGPVHALFGLPTPVRRALAGAPVRVDGQALDPDMQLLLRLIELRGGGGLTAAGGPAMARKALIESTPLVDLPRIEPVYAQTVEFEELRSRLYTPAGLPEGSPLLVFYHGGGWVIGDLDTHDNMCRYLALHAGVRVLAVDYRVAPEFPFPTALDDAMTAYRYAREHAAELGADPGAVAVGGDSAGGNLALVVGLQADPDYVLTFYPATSPGEPTRSRKELFADGFFLTDKDIDYFSDYYCPPKQRNDARFAPALAEDLSAMPPCYIAAAGFDPLRDDIDAFAAKLRAAGVPLVLRRHSDLIHGFGNMLRVGPRPQQALSEAAGALASALSVRARTPAR